MLSVAGKYHYNVLRLAIHCHTFYQSVAQGLKARQPFDAFLLRIIGGIVDLYIFMGPTPEEVIRQYHEVIGRPALPPYWSLGLHQSRWGYPNLEALQSVVANYSAAGLPLEVIWSDIDYMHTRFRNAEFDPLRFPVTEMSAFVKELKSNGQHWVPIIDAGIAASSGYQVYEDGSRDGVWIQDHTGEPYVGQVGVRWLVDRKFALILQAVSVQARLTYLV